MQRANKNFIETTKKFFTFDVSTSIRGFHQQFLLVCLIQPNETFLSIYNEISGKSRTSVKEPTVEVGLEMPGGSRHTSTDKKKQSQSTGSLELTAEN